jgi:hypothetical protein
MRKIKILEHISLDGVIQHSADDGDFPYTTGPRPMGPPLAEMQSSLRMAGASICCLAVAPTISGRASGQRRRAVRWRTASMRQKNMSLPTVRRVLNGPRSRALGRTSSRAFAASRRRTARTLSFGVAPR